MHIGKTRKLSSYPMGILMVATLLAHTGLVAGEFNLGPSTEDKRKFSALTSTKWLTCTFDPLESTTGEVIEAIFAGGSNGPVRFKTKPPEESETARFLTELKDSLRGDDANKIKVDADILLHQMTFVFNSKKSKVSWLLPHSSLVSGDKKIESFINIQDVGWVAPGALLVTTIVGSSEDSMLRVIAIYSRKTADGEFVGVVSNYFGAGIILMSIRCTDEISDDIKPSVLKIHRELDEAG